VVNHSGLWNRERQFESVREYRHVLTHVRISGDTSMSRRQAWGLFKPGAYLYSTPKEISENDFVSIAGGIDKVMQFRMFPYVSLVLDNPEDPFLVGHFVGETIKIAMDSHILWQTMEWMK
jgi:hypothetical protein